MRCYSLQGRCLLLFRKTRACRRETRVGKCIHNVEDQKEGGKLSTPELLVLLVSRNRILPNTDLIRNLERGQLAYREQGDWREDSKDDAKNKNHGRGEEL